MKKFKIDQRVFHPRYGYGTITEDGQLRVHVQWDNGKHGGAEVNQLLTVKEAKEQGY